MRELRVLTHDRVVLSQVYRVVIPQLQGHQLHPRSRPHDHAEQFGQLCVTGVLDHDGRAGVRSHRHHSVVMYGTVAVRAFRSDDGWGRQLNTFANVVAGHAGCASSRDDSWQVFRRRNTQLARLVEADL